MRALRLPAPNTRSLMDSLARSNSALLVRSLAAETSAGPGPVQARYRWLLTSWSNAGSPRFLGNPSHAFAPLYDPGRSDRSHLGDRPSAAPSGTTKKAPAICISGLNHAASASAAYASSSALPHSHARLASGWRLTFAGGESNPLDSDERFRSSTSGFLLSQAYPGATSPAAAC